MSYTYNYSSGITSVVKYIVKYNCFFSLVIVDVFSVNVCVFVDKDLLHLYSAQFNIISLNNLSINLL